MDILEEIKVLYVEDDETIRDILSTTLKRKIKHLETATDGEEGLRKYKTFNPDIIVSDIKMPNMDGLEMARLIKEDDPHFPIIITSAHGESEVLLKAIDIGINGYVLKPIDKKKLFSIIEQFARSRMLEKELEYKNKQLYLQSKNAALGELIENIAHQWRQPLSVISTTAGIMQLQNEMGTLEKKDIEDLLDNIVTVTQDLSQTIEYFRNAFVSSRPEMKKFNVKKLLENMISNLSLKLSEKNIKVILDIPDDLRIKNYPNLFLQSIVPIVRNSIDILEEKSLDEKLIFIEAGLVEDETVIKIKDNGGGISPSIIDKVFDPYFTTKHKTAGKGLGLYSAMQMVNNGMNGSIEVETSEFNYNGKDYRGALFVIRLK